MNDLNFVLDVLCKTTQLLNERVELTEQEEQLRRDLGEAFSVTSNEIKFKKNISTAMQRICNDAKIMSLGESGDFVKVAVDNVNTGIRLINTLK